MTFPITRPIQTKSFGPAQRKKKEKKNGLPSKLRSPVALSLTKEVCGGWEGCVWGGNLVSIWNHKSGTTATRRSRVLPKPEWPVIFRSSGARPFARTLIQPRNKFPLATPKPSSSTVRWTATRFADLSRPVRKIVRWNFICTSKSNRRTRALPAWRQKLPRRSRTTTGFLTFAASNFPIRDGRDYGAALRITIKPRLTGVDRNPIVSRYAKKFDSKHWRFWELGHSRSSVRLNRETFQTSSTLTFRRSMSWMSRFFVFPSLCHRPFNLSCLLLLLSDRRNNAERMFRRENLNIIYGDSISPRNVFL